MQLTVLANLEIGLHEQTRLQPEIRAALDSAEATTEDLGRRVLATAFPGVRPVVRVPAAALAGAVAKRLQRASSAVAREVITESFMVLSLPGRVLALGANLADAFPDALRPATEPELEELLARFEPAAGGPDDCGARDWSVLDERMHYIAHLFRAFHERPELAGPPFTGAQLASLAGGALPDGEL
jgi:hypothetical protein